MPETLRDLRKRRGLTQAQLAMAVGKTQMFIAHLESGHKRLPVELAAPLARVLKVKPAHLHSLSRLAALQYTLDRLSGLEGDDLVRAGDEGRLYVVRLVKLVMECVAAGEANTLTVDLPSVVVQAANEIVTGRVLHASKDEEAESNQETA